MQKKEKLSVLVNLIDYDSEDESMDVVEFSVFVEISKEDAIKYKESLWGMKGDNLELLKTLLKGKESRSESTHPRNFDFTGKP